MSTHSSIPPSGAHRWVNCPASVRQQRDYKDEESDAAREGTAAHELAERMLHAATKGQTISYEVVGTLASNGVLIDDEMYEACSEYAQVIRNIMIESGVFGGDNLGIEAKLHAPIIHEQSYGYCDTYIHDGNNWALHVFDFKYGFRYVDAFENWQLINYCAAIIGHLDGISDTKLDVHMHIFQPRAYGRKKHRVWKVKACDLRGYYNILNAKAHEAMGDNPSCYSGPWCHGCKAVLDCEAATDAYFNAIDYVHNQGNLIATDNDALGRSIAAGERALEAIEVVLEARKTEGLLRAQRGERITGYEVKNGRGSQRWTYDSEHIINLGDSMGIDLRKPAAPITPKQAIKAGLDEKLIDAFSQTTKGEPKLSAVNLKATREALSQ